MTAPDASGSGHTSVAAPGVLAAPVARVRPNARLLALLAVGHMVIDVNQGALPAILPFLRETFALSYAAAGTIMLVANVTSSVIQPLFGYLSDRTARRWLLPVSASVSGLGLALTGVAPSYAAVLALVVVMGFGVAAYHPEGYKTASHVAGDRKATGLSFFSIGGNVGIALGPPIITTLVTGFGLAGSLAMLLPSLAVAALLTVSLPSFSAPVQVQAQARSAEGGRTMVGAMALLILVVTLRSWTSLGLTTFVPFFYIDYLKADPRLVGPLLFVFLGAGALGTLVGGPLADRWGARRFMVSVFFLATPLTLAFLFARGAWAFLLLGAAGFVLVSTFSVSVVLGQAYLPRHLGMASGLIVGFAIGTGGLGVALLGWVADHWGLLVALGIAGVMPLLGFFAALFLPEPRRG
ncbi:MAG: MFS transporter [Candidatus Rokubacteria bacterium]|nr:MFS transporter [Candidatus Rokubacteria bacterium]